jgi:FkbM family methyltransferase
MIERSLEALNHASCWQTPVGVWGGRFHPPTADRFLYLWLHRLGLMGTDRALLQEHVEPGTVAADIGANIGLYTYLLSRCVGEEGFVYSFEPDPQLFAALLRNCVANGIRNVGLHNLALGARSAAMKLRRSLFNSGDNRLAEQMTNETPRDVSVSVRALDEVLDGRLLDFIKIDVQGWEFEALKGMRETLTCTEHMRIYCEFWPAGLRGAGCDPRELLAFLRELGFRVHRIEGRRLNPHFDEVELAGSLKGSQWTNLLAIR